MKKLLTVATALFLCGGMVLNAQLPTPKSLKDQKQIVKDENVPAKVNTSGNKDSKRTSAGPNWFTPAEAIRTFNGGATSGYSFVTLFPDTNALFTYQGTNGPSTFQNNVVSVGIVFDPRSVIYDGNPFKTTRWSNYTVDSLKFTFFYRRFNSDPSLVDTLLVTTFDRSSISRGFTSIYAGAVDYSTDRYRAGGTGATVNTILLTINDTASSAQERAIAVAKTVNGSNNGANYFGATVTFLPAYKGYNHTTPFDTVADFTTGAVGPNKTNIVRLFGYFDQSKYAESTTVPAVTGARIYNHGIYALDDQRYQMGTTKVDYYYPASYTSALLVPFIEFKIMSPNVSVNTLSNAAINNIYPNPANGGDVVLEMTSSVDATAVVTITDVTGKVVKTFDATLVNGANEISMNVDGLSKGMYVVSVKADGVNSVSKLTIE